MAGRREVVAGPGPAAVTSLGRALLRATPYVAAAAAAGVGAASWGASHLLLTPTKGRWRMYGPVRVVNADLRNGLITLRGADSAIPGTWGLNWPGGCGQVDDALWVEPAGDGQQAATRPFRYLEGEIPTVGLTAQWDPHVWPDRHDALGLVAHEVPVAGSVGPLPAWVYPGSDERTWAVFVHGRKSYRAQAFRALRTTSAAGLTGMVVSYRNDHWLPRTGTYGMGHTEWQDVEAAVEFAIGQGAERFVLVGYSLGGAIISSFLRRSPLADRVIGVVLDAPVLDWEKTLRGLARNARVPNFLVTTSMAAAALRAGIDWDALDHLSAATEFRQPTLLFHGEDDATVPVESSDLFADLRPDLVRYFRVPGAGHVTAWNHGPVQYDERLASFLQSLDLQPRRRARARPTLRVRHVTSRELSSPSPA